MNDKNDIVDSINNVSEEETQTESQRVYTLFYTFFLIPLMIVVFGALFFGLFYTITEEPTDVNQLLNKLETGSQRDKSDASIQLNQLFFNDPETYDSSYRYRIIDIHNSSKEDKYSDSVLRIHTIMIMGNTGDQGFGDVLIKELSSEESDFRIKAIESLGKIQYKAAAIEIEKFLKKDKPFLEKLAATGALGNIGNSSSIKSLVALIESWPLSWLDSDGPELRWDAALALLKLDYGDSNTETIINNLLDREYLKAVKKDNNTLTENQINEVILKILTIINSIIEKNNSLSLAAAFEDNVLKLSESDPDLEIRDFAKKLYKHYK